MLEMELRKIKAGLFAKTVIKSLIGITFNARKDTIEKGKLNLSYHILIENTRENHFNGTLTLEGVRV